MTALFEAADWHPPKNVYIEIEGDDCPVPEIDEFTLECVLRCADSSHGERLGDMSETLKWLKSLSDAEVEAGTIYFLDRWTWDTGHPLDGFFGRILEIERSRRRDLTRTLESSIKRNHVMEILDELAEREKNGDPQV